MLIKPYSFRGSSCEELGGHSNIHSLHMTRRREALHTVRAHSSVTPWGPYSSNLQRETATSRPPNPKKAAFPVSLLHTHRAAAGVTRAPSGIRAAPATRKRAHPRLVQLHPMSPPRSQTAALALHGPCPPNPHVRLAKKRRRPSTHALQARPGTVT